jgi:hypothetical protein
VQRRPRRAPGLSGLRHLNVSENGDGTLRGIYFESALSLTPDDVNDRHFDVYEWRDGHVSLMSPGSSDDHAFYSGNSRDGRDVFFQTTQRISPWEIEAKDGDVYDARIDGGLPDPPQPPAICNEAGVSCQGPGSGQSAPLSRTTDGAGDEEFDQGARRRLAVGLSAVARRRAARTGVLALRVRTSVSGRVRASARARVRGRLGHRAVRRVGAAGRRTAAGRAAVLRLRLNAAARRQLRAAGSLRLFISVQLRGASTRSLVVTLRRPGR